MQSVTKGKPCPLFPCLCSLSFSSWRRVVVALLCYFTPQSWYCI